MSFVFLFWGVIFQQRRTLKRPALPAGDACFSHLVQVEFMSLSDFVRFLATPDTWLNEAKKLSHGVRDLLVGRHDVK